MWSVLSLTPSCRHTIVPSTWIFIDPPLHVVILSGTTHAGTGTLLFRPGVAVVVATLSSLSVDSDAREPVRCHQDVETCSCSVSDRSPPGGDSQRLSRTRRSRDTLLFCGGNRIAHHLAAYCRLARESRWRMAASPRPRMWAISTEEKPPTTERSNGTRSGSGSPASVRPTASRSAMSVAGSPPPSVVPYPPG